MLKFVLTGYIEEALARAEYDKLDDGSFHGRIPGCKGVIAYDLNREPASDRLAAVRHPGWEVDILTSTVISSRHGETYR